MVTHYTEVKPCRKCAVQIPVEAGICPYCGKSQRSPVKPLAVVLLLVLLASLAGMWAVSREEPEVFFRKNLEQVRSKVEETVYPGLGANALKNIKVGMSVAQVRDLIGEPYEINRAASEGMVTEQWVIRAGSGYQYLYFDNGILKTIETR